MKLPEDLRKRIEALGISPDLPEDELLDAIDDKELEIGYDKDWEMTDVGFAVEKLYDEVFAFIENEEDEE